MSQSYKIARGECAAFSWTPEGICHGVLLKGGGRDVKVVAYWRGEGGSKASSIGETLSIGRRELGVKEGVYCIAGPEEGGWGMADLLMPELKPDELRSALAFEVRKRTPIALEHLNWGYRLLPKESIQDEKVTGRTPVRLFYAKSDLWRRWLEGASGLGHLDMMAVAPVLLDPFMQGETVFFPGETAFKYLPGKVGRDVVPATAEENKVGSFHECLPYSNLVLGSLGDKPLEEQLSYLKVITMAIYGMGREVEKDKRTMPALPDKMKPARYMACRFIASCLAVLIIAMLGAGLVQSLQQRVARLRQIRSDISKVEAEIARLNNMDSIKANQAAKDFEAEISKYTFEAPELPDVLIELTQLIKPPAWIGGSFDWKSELGDTVVPITFTIREPVSDSNNLDLCKRLNDSPILGDAQELKSSMLRDNKQERRITLKARYDTAEEREYYEREQAELRAKKAEEEAQKAAQKAAQKPNEEDEDQQVENEGGNVEAPPPPPGGNGNNGLDMGVE
ncbi:MAG: hypothetical protein IKP00_07870 [Victivallales bacterium]|nr:hypothetical protein [Victivallales bacterium]